MKTFISNTPMVNSGKYVYSNFQCYTIAAINSAEPNQKVIKPFPNATFDFLNFKLPNQGSAKIRLSALTGRVVKSETLSAANSRIDISALPNGIYLLNIQTEEGAQTSKIVKQ